MIGALLLIIFVVIATNLNKKPKKQQKKVKRPLFGAIVLATIIPTVVLFSATIYLNTTSDSKGPVHWHADIEFWACGQELELRDPIGMLSNKIGSPTFHEHNDKRIHLEGVVVDKEYDASLGKFMHLTGGDISKDGITVPIEPSVFENEKDGDNYAQDLSVLQNYVHKDVNGRTVIELKNGDMCSDQKAELQAFVYRFDGKSDTYAQRKLTDASAYIMRDEAVVPPGDCVIVEFAASKERTDKLCEQYGVRDVARCKEFGVENPSPKLCKVREVNNEGGM